MIRLDRLIASIDMRDARKYLGVRHEKCLENLPKQGLRRLSLETGIGENRWKDLTARFLGFSDYSLDDVCMAVYKLACALKMANKLRDYVFSKLEFAYLSPGSRRKQILPDFSPPSNMNILAYFRRVVYPQITGSPYNADKPADNQPKVCQNPDCRTQIPPDTKRRKYCSDRCGVLVNQASLRGKVRERRARASGKEEKISICLSCNHPFLSEGPWNRICPKCSERNVAAPPRARAAHINNPAHRDYLNSLERQTQLWY